MTPQSVEAEHDCEEYLKEDWLDIGRISDYRLGPTPLRFTLTECGSRSLAAQSVLEVSAVGLVASGFYGIDHEFEIRYVLSGCSDLRSYYEFSCPVADRQLLFQICPQGDLNFAL